MDDKRKKARQWLMESTYDEFERFVEKAKLTPRQIQIIKLKIVDNLLNYQVASRLNLSIETVKTELAKIFDRALKLM